MIKKILRGVFTGLGVGAPDAPQRIRIERNYNSHIKVRLGEELSLWLKPNTYEIEVYIPEDNTGEGLIGTSHNYALARYMMQHRVPFAKVYGANDVEIILDIIYKGRKPGNFSPADEDFV